MNLFAPDALQGEVAVVTGANGGLGRTISTCLSELGARVVTLDLEKGEEPDSVQTVALSCDVSNEQQVTTVSKEIRQRYGAVSILVNNAAVLGKDGPLDEMTSEAWDRVFAVNLRGAMLCSRLFGLHMLERRKGSIVNVASVAAKLPNAVTAYGPSKAGVLGLTRQIAVEWGPRGVRANAISPGLIMTPMSNGFYADPERRLAREAKVAQKRIGTPTDIARVVAFLASDASGYVNGQEIVVDGGFGLTSLMSLQGCN